MLNMHGLTIFGIVLVAIGTLLIIKGQQIINNENSQELQNKTGRVEKLSQENIELNKELAKLNKEIVKTITGGNSYCYLNLNIEAKSKLANIAVVHQGKYPLYDLTIRIVDTTKVKGNLKKYKEAPSISALGDLFQQDLNINVGTLNPGKSHMSIIQWPFGAGAERSYNIFFNARNGSFTQLYRQTEAKGHWVQATKVQREINGRVEVLYEEVERDFPLDENGVVLWNK